MFKKIWIAYDGSEHAERAARISADMAQSLHPVDLCLACVIEPIPKELGEPYAENLITERTLEGQELLQLARKHIGGNITIHDELLFSSPAESIMEITNTRALGGLKGLLLSSQTQKVISLSNIPVLDVK